MKSGGAAFTPLRSMKTVCCCWITATGLSGVASLQITANAIGGEGAIDDDATTVYIGAEGVLDIVAGVTEKIGIGNLFIDIFEEQAKACSRSDGDVKWLAQGTIYPDVIESAGGRTGKAHVIKSHHNVGGLPEYMKMQLLEPLRELFKDEVRRIGMALGLAPEIVHRHPFPGPGLGVRILGEVREEYLEPLAQADHIFIEELHKHDLYDKVSQAFAVFLPVSMHSRPPTKFSPR